MPKQHRWEIKRILEQAHDCCNKAQNYIIIVGHQFETVHPEYYDAFSSIVAALEKVKSAINEMTEQI